MSEPTEKKRRVQATDDDDDDDDGGGGGGVVERAPAMQFAEFIAHTPVMELEGLTLLEAIAKRDLLLKELLKNMKERQRKQMCELDKKHFKRICDGSDLYQDLVKDYYPEFADVEKKRAIVGGTKATEATDGSWAVYFRGLHKSTQIREACTSFLQHAARGTLPTHDANSYDAIYRNRCFWYFTMPDERRRDLQDEFLATPAAAAATPDVNAIRAFVSGDRRRYEHSKFPWREFFFFLVDRFPLAAGISDNGRLSSPIDEKFRVGLEKILENSVHFTDRILYANLLLVKRRFFGDGPFTWVICSFSLIDHTIRYLLHTLYRTATIEPANLPAVANRVALDWMIKRRPGVANAAGSLQLALQPGGIYAHIEPPLTQEGETEVVPFRPGTLRRNRWRFFAFDLAVRRANRSALNASLAAYVGDWFVDRTWLPKRYIKWASTDTIEYLTQLDEIVASGAIPERVGADAFQDWWFDQSREAALERALWWYTKALEYAAQSTSPSALGVVEFLRREFDPKTGARFRFRNLPRSTTEAAEVARAASVSAAAATAATSSSSSSTTTMAED